MEYGNSKVQQVAELMNADAENLWDVYDEGDKIFIEGVFIGLAITLNYYEEEYIDFAEIEIYRPKYPNIVFSYFDSAIEAAQELDALLEFAGSWNGSVIM